MTKGYRKGGLEGGGSDQRDTGRGIGRRRECPKGYRKGGLEGGGSDQRDTGRGEWKEEGYCHINYLMRYM